MANTEIGIRLRLDSSGVVTGIQAAGQQMQALEKSTAGAASAAAHFARMGHLATSALGLHELVQAADAYSTLTSRIRLASDGIGDAARAQAELFDIASRARTSVESLSQTYAGLARAAGESGRSQTEMLRTTETIAKAMSIGGGAVESQKAALMQFSQALSAGTLRGEELNSVVEQAPRLAKALADGLGISTGALKKFAEEGKITSDAIFMALERSGAKIDAEAARIPSTVGQAMTVLGDQFMQAVGTFDQAYQVSAKLADGILALSENLDVVIPVAALATAGLLAYRNQALLATVATRGLGTAVGVMSGPIGWVATALGLGLTAWLAWKDAGVSSEQAVEKQVVDSNAEIQSRIDAQIQKLRERNRIAAEGMPDVLTGVQRTAADAAAKYAQAYSSWQSLSKLAAAPAKPATGASFLPSLGGVDELLMPSDRLAQRQREAASAAAKAFAEYQELIGEASREASASTKKSHEDFLKSYRTGAEKVADALKDYESKFKPKLAAGEITQAAYDRGYKAIAASAPKAASAVRSYASANASAVDSELASLQTKVQAEAQYAVQLAQHGLAAERLTEGEKEAAKIGYELAAATKAKGEATTQAGRAKLDARIATLQLHQAEAQRLADYQLQNRATKDALELGQKAINDLQKQADAIRDKTAALAEENAAYGQINPTLAKALAQGKDLAGQMVMTDGSVMDYERAQRAAEAWALMNGYIGQLMQQDWNKINGAVQEWQRSATEQAKLYEDEARLSGLSALERAKVVAARQVELKLAKQIAEIEHTQFSEDPVQDAAKKAQLIADATTAAQTESSAAVAKVVQEDWTRTSEKIEEVLIDALMSGGKSGAEYIEGLFRSMVLRPVLQAIVSPVAGVITSALGVPGAAQAGQGGGLLMGNAIGLNTAYNAITNGIRSSISDGFSKLVSNNIGQKLGLSYYDGNAYQTTAMGEQFSGVAQGLGSAATAYGVQKMLSGGYKTGEAGLVDDLTAIGGYFDPTGGLIAGAVGGAVNRAFGRKLKDQGLEGTFGGADGFDGNSYEFYKGGWFRSDKTKRKALDSGVEDALETQFKALQTQTALMAQTLGLGVDSVADFTTKIKVSFKGLSEEQISERMAEEFGKVGEAMAQAALGQTEYARTGETAAETLTRLSSSLTTVNGTFDVLGQKLLDTSLAGADMASQLVDLMGGLESFTATTASYLQNFYTEAERADVATRQLTDALAEIGINAMPATRDAYRDLVESQDLTTESGRETYAALMGLSGAFAALVPAMQSASAIVEDIEQSYQRLTNVTFTAEQAAEQRIGLEEKLLTLQGNTTELRRRELLAIDASNRGLQRLVWALDDVQTASASVLDAEKKLADAQAQAQQQQYDTQYEAAKAIADAARTAADEMKSLADTLREFVLGETQTPSELFADTLKKALGGDVEAMRALPQVATSQIDAARQSASTQADYAIARAQTLNAVQAAAAIAGQLGAVSVVDPVRQVAQPTAAQDPTQEALGKLNTAIEVLTMSIATALGGDLVDKLGKIDTNLDGSISESEFKAAFSGTASDNVLSKIFAALDSDGSKMITKLEAIKSSTSAFATSFGTFSVNLASALVSQSGSLSTSALSAALGAGKDTAASTKTASALDFDGSGVVTKSEAELAQSVASIAEKYASTASKDYISGASTNASSNTDNSLNSVYKELLGRDVDVSGASYYAGKSIESVIADIKSSPEYAVRNAAGSSAQNLLNDLVNSQFGISNSTKAFHTGGYTGPGGKYEAAGVVHRGEVVFSQDDIARLGGVRAVEAIRTGTAPGYADGGVVGSASGPVVVPAPLVPGCVAMAPRPATPDPVQQERDAQARDQAQREAQQQTQDLIAQLRQVNSNLTDLKRSVDKSGQSNDQMNNKIFNMSDTTVKLLRKFDALGMPVVDVTPAKAAAEAA